MLLARFCPHGLLDSAMAETRLILGDQPSKHVSKRHPSISNLTKKQWRVMLGQDPYLGEVFPDPLVVANKRQWNIRDNLKGHAFQREERITPGMNKCGKYIFALMF